jgi:uncharacterized protein (DUF697 family)
MPGAFSPAAVWRVVRDVDLQAIREAAHARFQVLVAGAHEADVAAVRRLLSGAAGTSPHPWLVTAAPEEGLPPGATPALGVLVTRGPDLGDALSAMRDGLAARSLPVLTVEIGHPVTGSAAAAPRRGETMRLLVHAPDAAAELALADALARITPADLRLALARQLPPLRLPLMTAVIEETARANATYAFTTGVAEIFPPLTAPLNIGDMVILTKNQLLMSYRLALMAGRDGEPRTLVGEILGVLGGGLLFRQLARQLVGFIPVAGLLPKVAIAYGGTWGIGRAMVLWATEGREITTEMVRGFSKEGLERGRRLAARMQAEARAARATRGERWRRWRSYLPTFRFRRSTDAS